MHINHKYPNRIFLVSLCLGIAADLLFYQHGLLGINVPLFTLLCLLGLGLVSWQEQLTPTRANAWMAPAALLFAFLAIVRSEITIASLNGLIALGLIILYVGLFQYKNLAELSIWQYLFRPIISFGMMIFLPIPFGIQRLIAMIPRGNQMRQLAPVGRGLLVALPVLFVFVVLLTLADAVFAQIVRDIFSLRLPINIIRFIPQMLLIGFFGWMSCGALLTAIRSIPTPTTDQITDQPAPGQGWFGCIEALTVLTLLNLLFIGFTIIQAAYLFGGLDTLSRTGMTYADYARRGFFELVIVACLSIGLAWGLAEITRRDEFTWQRLAFNSSVGILAFLTLAMIASAFQRMWLYEQAYGFTHLRIYTQTFMLWLAILLGLFMVGLLTARPRWFSFGGSLAALMTMVALTLADPETLIVRANIARYAATGTLSVTGSDANSVESSYGEYRPSRSLDSDYLANLSPDATPALLEAIATLPENERQVIQEKLQSQKIWLEQVEKEEGWLSWSPSRSRALAALRQQLR